MSADVDYAPQSVNWIRHSVTAIGRSDNDLPAWFWDRLSERQG
jgi:hypothetical protein